MKTLRVGAGLLAWGLVTSGCFFLPTEEYPCTGDGDCAVLPGSTCNTSQGLCERGTQEGNTSSSGGAQATSEATSSPAPSSALASSSGMLGSSSSTPPSSSGPNLPPVVATPLVLHVAQGGTVMGTLDVTDPEQQPLTFTLLAPAAKGTASLAGSTVNYTAGPTARGEDAFPVEVRDPQGAAVVTRVRVVIASTFTPTKTWVGGGDGGNNLWSNYRNWSAGGVPAINAPGPGDDVLIPATALVMPVLDVAGHAGSLVVEAGAQLSLAAHRIGVIRLAQCEGTMTADAGGGLEFQVMGGEVIGTFPALYIQHRVTLLGDTTVSGVVEVDSPTTNATLTVETAALVAGSLNVTGAGLVRMGNTAGSVTVLGNARFDGRPTAADMTAGVLTVGGTFTANTFHTANTHLTVLNNTSVKTMQLAGNDIVFANVRVLATQTLGVSVNGGSGFEIAGNLEVLAPVAFGGEGTDMVVKGRLVTSAGSTLKARKLTLHDAAGTGGVAGQLVVVTLEMLGVSQPLVAGLNYQDVVVGAFTSSVDASVRLLDGVTLHNLEITVSTARAQVEGRVHVTGTLDCGNGGGIIMQVTEAELTVDGAAVLTGVGDTSELTDGLLVVKGDLSTRYEGFTPVSQHVTRLAGSTIQRITTEGAGPQGNNTRFQNLEVDNPTHVVLNPLAYVNNRLSVLRGSFEGAGAVVEVAGRLEVSAGAVLAVESVLLSNSADTLQVQGSLGGQLVTFQGGNNSQVMHVLPDTGFYPAVDIVHATVTIENGTKVGGRLRISEQSTTVTLVGAATGIGLNVHGELALSNFATLDLNGHSVQCNSLTVDSAAFDMVSESVDVQGPSVFQNPMAMTWVGGIFNAGGNLTVISPPINGNGLRPSGTHLLRFTADAIVTLDDSSGTEPKSVLFNTEVTRGRHVTLAADTMLGGSFTVRGNQGGTEATLTVPAGVTVATTGAGLLVLEQGAKLFIDGTFTGNCQSAGAQVTHLDGSNSTVCQ